MKSSNSSVVRRASLLLLATSLLAAAQTVTLTLSPPMAVSGKRGSTVSAKIQARLREGYHCNSNRPGDEFLIPLKLTWTAGVLQDPVVKYPKPTMEKFPFSEKALSVYTGQFELVTEFKVPADAKPGQSTMSGKVKFQACDDRSCMPPKTLDVQFPIIVE